MGVVGARPSLDLPGLVLSWNPHHVFAFLEKLATMKEQWFLPSGDLQFPWEDA